MEQTLEQILLQAYPDRGPARVDRLKKAASGWESEVYTFRARYKRGDSLDLVLRMYPGDVAGAARKAEGEFRTMRLLGLSGYPVPRVDYLDISGQVMAQPLMLMEQIHGKALWDRMYHHPIPFVRKKSLEQFCRLFVHLHGLAWERGVPPEHQVHPTSPTALIDTMLARGQELVALLPLEGFNPVWAWMHENKYRAGGMRVSVLHWDFHPNNVLVCPNGRAFVIDWTGAELSDYRFDLAWTLLLTLCYEGPAWREAVLREYERQAGERVQALDFFDVVACFRRLYSIAASVRYGAEKLGMRPGAEQTMLSQKKPIRAVYELLQAHTGLRVPEVEAMLS